mmetsp:Transcript_4930/g.14297  ORF Transcript_4930/g.14297 Transcript_4930/m.14297 type:complete len:316 (-) Transcript_4930:786-1733(-)|eukprot:CAMPEP_0172360428 /NCGR_PEP_ID=MMETSP1060-20121228/4447_1 /TAXON_ID=37318 /ORGANISM="Pseudo-nitzschia pungens, Strain cf. cingulata" /LENGTH=315 /DNA_ID=CAMNT_0013082411 /DNA_START=490 /DNA_END=1437 /DNA_ORIENTATION=+
MSTDCTCLCPSTSYFDSDSDSDSEEFNYLDAEFLAYLVALVTVIVSVIGYFVQRERERRKEAEADQEAASDLDRRQALERVRLQLSVFIGPLHRSFKTLNTCMAQYRIAMGDNKKRWLKAIKYKGRNYWMPAFDPEALEQFIQDPATIEAKRYRNMVSRRVKPIYTRVRELILDHSSDLADMPTQEEWLQKHTEESVLSPYTGSININVIIDTLNVWSYEFDDIIESWEEGDFTRMQPETHVAWLICNDLIDTLYDTAKEKEVLHSNRVRVHKNVEQADYFEAGAKAFELRFRREEGMEQNHSLPPPPPPSPPRK